MEQRDFIRRELIGMLPEMRKSMEVNVVGKRVQQCLGMIIIIFFCKQNVHLMPDNRNKQLNKSNKQTIIP